MWTPSSEIIKVAQQTGITVSTDHLLLANHLRKEALHLFGAPNTGAGLRLFEKILPNSIGSSDPNAFKWLCDFHNQNILAFFEKGDDSVFIFDNLCEFVEVYENCALFTIYLMDLSKKFLICCSCEQTLITTGTASYWLESKLKE